MRIADKTGMSTPTSIRDGFRSIRSQLTQLLRAQPGAAGEIADILLTVDAVEHLVDRGSALAPEVSIRQRRGKPKQYRLERRGSEEVLAEYRQDDENPFRCPKSTYDALARVVAGMTGWNKYSQIMRNLKRELPDTPADYQVRVVLRFWTQPEVGLLEKARARYRSLQPKQFAVATAAVWKHIPR